MHNPISWDGGTLSKAVELKDVFVQFITHHGCVAPVIEPVKLKAYSFPSIEETRLESGAGLLNDVPAPLLTHVEISSHEYHDSTALAPGSIFLPAVTHPSAVSLKLHPMYLRLSIARL